MGGVVIAGTHSGCGKTTLTLGILAALRRRGRRVQSFKAGPDFIDAGLHALLTDRPSRNLDLWMCGEDYVRKCYYMNSSDVDISIVEGVMGLFDGKLSTASLAACLNLPVILAIDSYGMAESAGAVAKGFLEYCNLRNLRFGGVIFNRVASESHYKRLCSGVRDIPVLGYLPRDLRFEIPHRHLGLTTIEESPLSRENLDSLAKVVLECIDVYRVIELAEEVTPEALLYRERVYGVRERGLPKTDKTIAVARDKAFCFYYEDNLDLLRKGGARIITFSPMSDSAIPAEADAVYLGGGYPELYADRLSRNSAMLDSVRNWAEAGKPIYAECGGLMYLSKGIYDFERYFFRMSGVFPFETEMKKGRSRLGYREVTLKTDCILGKKGAVLKGHEFHYSVIVERIAEDAPVSSVYLVHNGTGEDSFDEGYAYKRTLASYIHLHFGSNRGFAAEFVGSKGER